MKLTLFHILANIVNPGIVASISNPIHLNYHNTRPRSHNNGKKCDRKLWGPQMNALM